MKPAAYWRNVIMNNLVPHGSGLPPGPYGADVYLQTAETIYNQAQRLLQTDIEGNERLGIAGQLYLVSVFLLASGRLEVAEDVLRNNPGPPQSFMVGCVADLIPLPDDLRSLEDTEKVISWIRNHQGSLSWNETEGRFHLVCAGGH